MPTGLDWLQQHDWLMESSKRYEAGANFAMALAHSRMAFELQSHRHDTLMNTARLHAHQGGYHEAAELLSFAHTKKPQDKQIIESLAAAQERAGRYAEAAETFRKVSQFRTDDPAVLLSLASALGAGFDAGDLEEADRVLQRLRAVRLLRGEIGKLGGLQPEQYDLPIESQRKLRTLHFTLASKFALQGNMSSTLQHFGRSCHHRVCPFGDTPLSTSLLSYYTLSDSSEGDNFVHTTAPATANVDEVLQQLDLTRYRHTLQDHLYKDKLMKELEHSRRQKTGQQQPDKFASSSCMPNETIVDKPGEPEPHWRWRLKPGLSEYDGSYRRDPVENDFHVGTVHNYTWMNRAGLTWGLLRVASINSSLPANEAASIGANHDQLRCDDDCPYSPHDHQDDGGLVFYFERGPVPIGSHADTDISIIQAQALAHLHVHERHQHDIDSSSRLMRINSFTFLGERYVRDQDSQYERDLYHQVHVSERELYLLQQQQLHHRRQRLLEEHRSQSEFVELSDGDSKVGPESDALGWFWYAVGLKDGRKEAPQQSMFSSTVGLCENADDTPLRMWWRVLPQQLLHSLQEGFRKGSLFEVQAPGKMRPSYEVDVGLEGKLSHWFPLKEREPRNTVEQAISFLQHLIPGEVREKVKGVEWWVQSDRHTGDGPGGTETMGIPFHYEVDDALLEQEGRWAQPMLSSILFLHGARPFDESPVANGGWLAPTLICNQTRAQLLRGQYRAEGWLVEPTAGQFILFRGGLLRGILPARRAVSIADAALNNESVAAESLASDVRLLLRQAQAQVPPLMQNASHTVHISWWDRECVHRRPRQCLQPTATVDWEWMRDFPLMDGLPKAHDIISGATERCPKLIEKVWG